MLIVAWVVHNKSVLIGRISSLCILGHLVGSSLSAVYCKTRTKIFYRKTSGNLLHPGSLLQLYWCLKSVNAIRYLQLYVFSFPFHSQFQGSTPSACWNKIYKRIRKLQSSSDGSHTEEKLEGICRSGSDMFGFSNPEVAKLIQV